MPVDMIVCVKQVIDPEAPASSFRIDAETKQAVTPIGMPLVLNGFDENAVEASLRIKESIGGHVTILSVGNDLAVEVMKKPLSMGADEIVLVQDPVITNLDSFAISHIIAAAINRIGRYDLVICGRQASDWDNAQVPLGLAEILGLPCLTLAQHVEVVDSDVIVHRALADGYEVVEADLPALVTVSNELGEPRYPTLSGIMAAGRKAPEVWDVRDISLDLALLEPRVTVSALEIPVSERVCEFIEGENEADAGRLLALRLREEKLI